MYDVKWMAMAIILMALLATAEAQFGGYTGGNNGGNPFNGNNGGSGSGSGSGSTSGSGSGSGSGSAPASAFGGGPANSGANFNFEQAARARAIHGIIGAIAMVVVFPSGAILMRIIPSSRIALYTHAAAQVLALGLLAATVGYGVMLVRQLGEAGVDLMAQPSVSYHPIIGFVVLVCLVVQPFLGFMHHERFKRLRRRQVWSYLHLANGRVVVTLGIINGAFGLNMAGASHQLKTAYYSAAGAMWGLWVVVAVCGEVQRWRRGHRPWRQSKPNEGGVPF